MRAEAENGFSPLERQSCGRWKTQAVRATNDGSTEVVTAGPAEAKLFITPGFSFRIVDELLTNFQLAAFDVAGAGLCIRGERTRHARLLPAVEAKIPFLQLWRLHVDSRSSSAAKRETLSEAPDQTATLPNEH